MKKSLLLSILLAGVSYAGFEDWTNSAGKTAQLELVKVTETGGELVGEFKMRNGKTISLKASELSDADAERLAAWKPAAEAEAKPATAAGGPSIYDKLLGGNLIKLDGKRVGKAEVENPAKYYVFYYSASWCGPCQQFTPSLVEFYNANKNADFEIYYIPFDNDEKSMEGYMKDKSMPWPALKLSRADKFKKEVEHDVQGIPFIAITQPDGEVVDKGHAAAMLAKLKGLIAE
jgi:thiol-disulfide isomerase/thioredoxin